ncbi:acylneuraminate cytidylyltransferase family protein [uncultured Chitinophaga sp.]|uniref:acylneuraminate cytidylyltransferase family protein n=1 Tax=uncultured Chitinophaga sp. TaxID=339340 RepID=UPI0025F6E27A|nr:acylneuraminate cytidylyltransferase family protein [uncultured Chitinophaga sp.]
MSLLITICARGGSKGIPGKNIKKVMGRPLIDYSVKIAQAFAARYGGHVALSTDDEEIATVAMECGLESNYRRPAELGTDTAGKIDVINDIVLHEETKVGQMFKYVLDLDVTSPLRTLDDLEKAYRLINENTDALTLFSVNAAARNPYFNMVEQDESGYYRLSKKLPGSVLTRQSAPKVYDLNASFYFYRRAFFDTGKKSPITERSLVYVMDHVCFDLDHPIDFDFLTYLLEHNKLEISLI